MVVVAALFVLFFCPVAQKNSAPVHQLLRLRRGNYWIYSGTVEWSVIGQGAKTGKQHVRWKTEILEESTHRDLKAYLVKGGPFDLAWFEQGKKPGQYLWIAFGNRFYSLAVRGDMLKRFHDPRDSLSDLVEKGEPVIQFPLTKGICTQALKPERPRERMDLMYCWHNERKAKKTLYATGVPASAEVWETWYRTAPDHEHISFSPGIGIVAYDYSHHGTVAEAHVKLVEAHFEAPEKRNR